MRQDTKPDISVETSGGTWWGRESLSLLVFSLLLSMSLAVAHFQSSEKMSSPHDWMTYHVSMPYAGRAMAADVARLVVPMFPASVRTHHLAAVEALPFLLLEIVALFVAFRSIFYVTSKLDARPFVPFLAMALLVWEFTYMLVVNRSYHFWYTYDPVSIAVMTCGLALIVSGRFYWVLALIVVGTWNRETAILLALWWGLYQWRTVPVKRLAMQVGGLLLASTATKWIVLRLHHLNVHGVITTASVGEPRYLSNLAFWSHPKLIAVCGVFGFLWIFLPRAIRACRSGPAAGLVRCLWALVPYFAGMVLVGNLREIRIFTEFTPLVAMVLALGYFGRDQGLTVTPIVFSR